MPKRLYKEITAWLCELGFEFDRTNSKQVDFYVHHDHAEVAVTTGINDDQVRRLKARLQRDFGLQTDKDKSKRSATAVKERRAGDRARAHAEVERLEAIRDEIMRERAIAEHRTLGDVAAMCSPAEFAAIVRRMDENERELAYWRSLMTELPAPREQNVRHRT